ncbi:glutamate receptor ionotropic, kainate 1-like [Ruditapes philippinarum]|uniref:glutamate receptor ionotropic, kainate 1-like n=1 Tax=Ruditapes philippinarum TaxID=129788 RepID=UPI00295AF623|nr:glutamate receptor ionotropic, kainate 1-like [Ruditapes philippinarum]
MDYLQRIYAFIFILWNIRTSYGQSDLFRVAALFEDGSEYEGMRLAFVNAVTKVNMHSEVGPGRNIIYDMKTIAPHDSFKANTDVCREMKAHGGIAAVFGPFSEISRAHVHSLCNAFEIPHIQAIWDSREPREYFSISVYPDHDVLSQAFADIVKHWEWKTFTVIYEDGESLVRLHKLLEVARGDEYKMTIRRLEIYQHTYKSMLKELKEKPEYRIIIDCHASKIKKFLEEADELNMLSAYYHFHFTSLDMSTLDLDEFRHKGANITSMRLIDPNNPDVMSIMAEWGIMETNNLRSPLLGMRAIKTETALMYDAVYMYARALSGLANAQQISTESLNCNKRESWKKGDSLLNYMKALAYDGLSGKIEFKNGKRKEFRLGIVSLTTHGLIEIGHWTPDKGVNITVTITQQVHDDRERLRNMTLRVVTIYDPPYVINLTEPNEHGRMHEGFIIDLLDELAKILGFNYTIYEESKREYGSNVDGKWNGMIGDLIERDRVNKADIAAAGLTITYARAKVVDFTMPFLSLGITIIYRKPLKSPPDLFSFLKPLSADVWIYMIAAYLCVSFMLFVIARFTPYEWENPHPCNEESEEVENQFTILNSLWFTIGSLMQQGCDIMPKAISTRTVAILWWFFVLILVSSYTANLAAFLTMSRMAAPVENADDLANQKDIPYGTLNSGSTRNFFRVRTHNIEIRHETFPTSIFDRKTENRLGLDFWTIQKYEIFSMCMTHIERCNSNNI